MAMLKEQISKMLVQATQHQIDLLKKDITEIQASANEETKSSAGDKYETGRAMAQLEIDKLRNQLFQAENAIQVLNGISLENQSDQVKLGSLVKTTQGCFFISISSKEIAIENQMVHPISISAPMAKCLMGRKKGDLVEFLGRQFLIEDLS